MCESVCLCFRLEEEKAKAKAEAQAEAKQQIQAEVQKVLEKEQLALQQTLKDAIIQERKNIQDEQLASHYYVRRTEIVTHAQCAERNLTHLVP